MKRTRINLASSKSRKLDLKLLDDNTMNECSNSATVTESHVFSNFYFY